MSSKYEVYSNRVEPHDAQPPAPPKVTPKPQWEVLARLVEGTLIRKPLPFSGRWLIGGHFQRLEDGTEFDAALEVDGDVLATAESLRSEFLLNGSRDVESRLAALRRTVSDDVSRTYVMNVEAVLRLLLGMEKDNG